MNTIVELLQRVVDMNVSICIKPEGGKVSVSVDSKIKNVEIGDRVDIDIQSIQHGDEALSAIEKMLVSHNKRIEYENTYHGSQLQ